MRTTLRYILIWDGTSLTRLWYYIRSSFNEGKTSFIDRMFRGRVIILKVFTEYHLCMHQRRCYFFIQIFWIPTLFIVILDKVVNTYPSTHGHIRVFPIFTTFYVHLIIYGIDVFQFSSRVDIQVNIWKLLLCLSPFQRFSVVKHCRLKYGHVYHCLTYFHCRAFGSLLCRIVQFANK